jgi:Dna[CI] antecedent, DciA
MARHADRDRLGGLDRLGVGLRAELERFGPQAGMIELLDRWPAAVGTEIARRAWPARFARDGTLHVNTADSVWAFELGQQAEEIAGRLGVPKVRFAPGPLPEPTEAPGPAPALEPTAAEVAEARALAAPIADDELRESVQRAASLGLAQGRSIPPV